MSGLSELLYNNEKGKRFKAELNANGDYLYIGYAEPRFGTDKPHWQIQKILYHATFTDMPIDKQFANQDPREEFVWDDRATYNYG